MALPGPHSDGPVLDGYQIFESRPWDDWYDDGCIRSVIYYLRGAKDLQLGEWRALFPTEI